MVAWLGSLRSSVIQGFEPSHEAGIGAYTTFGSSYVQDFELT
jgi:hypothetical protein